ncbi:MAG: GIY-YIG nuclease family protein [Bacteroidales bacterium]|nr:GIY-YIG nuclease family protein [Bacteroidales bacterium]
MAAQTFNVDIQGYWRERNKSGIPNHSGVYFVYEATYNAGNETVTLLRLIYIGESENVRDRISNHEKLNDWLRYVRTGNELCYSTGSVQSTNRERVEAAYIFKHKPPVNDEYKNSFPFDQTTIISTGKTALLDTNFTVYRT